jgi:uncharacterized protein YeaO (DUF488 family)
MGDVVDPFGKLAAAYLALLRDGHTAELDRLVAVSRTRGLVLVTSAPDPTRSPAAVVVQALEERTGNGRTGPVSSQ